MSDFSYTTNIFNGSTEKYQTFEGEIWKTVPGFSRYEASTFGRLRNNKSQKLMSDRALDGGYINNSLINDENKEKKSKRHRIIALTFIPNIENKPTVNHKNHIRNDNHIDNLEWATMKEQSNHAIHKKAGFHISLKKPVNRCDINTGEIIQKYRDPSSAAEWVIENIILNREGNPISETNCSKRIKTASSNNKIAYGYLWKYSVQENMMDEEWKHIPSHLINNKEGYYISSIGRIKCPKGNITTGYTQGNYKMIGVANTVWRVHRLVAEVFLPKIKQNKHKTQVNHKDTNTTNNCVSNLEWVTPSENCQHAILELKIGIPIKITNIKTGEVNEYPNINAAEKLTKIKRGVINNRLNSGKLYNDEYKFEHLNPENEKKRILPNKLEDFGNSIEATNITTGEVKIYPSVTNCAEELNIDRRYIDTSISDNDIYTSRNTKKQYKFTKNASYLDKTLNRTSGEGTSITVHNITDGIKNSYKSIKDAAKEEGISRGPIDKRLNNKGGTGGWGMRIDWSFKMIDSKKSLPIIIIDLNNNNQKYRYDSINQANEGLSNLLNKEIRPSITKYIAKKEIYLNRFRFEYGK